MRWFAKHGKVSIRRREKKNCQATAEEEERLAFLYSLEWIFFHIFFIFFLFSNSNWILNSLITPNEEFFFFFLLIELFFVWRFPSIRFLFSVATRSFLRLKVFFFGGGVWKSNYFCLQGLKNEFFDGQVYLQREKLWGK